MAKMTITVDTEAGTLSVATNGNVHENVQYVSIYKDKDYEGKDFIHFSVEKFKKEDGLRIRECVSASKKTLKDIFLSGR